MSIRDPTLTMAATAKGNVLHLEQFDCNLLCFTLEESNIQAANVSNPLLAPNFNNNNMQPSSKVDPALKFSVHLKPAISVKPLFLKNKNIAAKPDPKPGKETVVLGDLNVAASKDTPFVDPTTSPVKKSSARNSTFVVKNEDTSAAIVEPIISKGTPAVHNKTFNKPSPDVKVVSSTKESGIERISITAEDSKTPEGDAPSVCKSAWGDDAEAANSKSKEENKETQSSNDSSPVAAKEEATTETAENITKTPLPKELSPK